MNKTINDKSQLPAGYFRIHWPQYQVLMDEENYDKDVIFCDGDAELFGLSTIALPITYLKRIENKLGSKTRIYFQVLNQNPELN